MHARRLLGLGVAVAVVALCASATAQATVVTAQTATVRTAPGSWPTGTLTSGQSFSVSGVDGSWAFGLARAEANRCGWILVSALQSTTRTSTDGRCDAPGRIPLNDDSHVANEGPSESRTVTCQDVTVFGNYDFDGGTGSKTPFGTLTNGAAVGWRYSKRGVAWIEAGGLQGYVQDSCVPRPASAPPPTDPGGPGDPDPGPDPGNPEPDPDPSPTGGPVARAAQSGSFLNKPPTIKGLRRIKTAYTSMGFRVDNCKSSCTGTRDGGVYRREGKSNMQVQSFRYESIRPSSRSKVVVLFSNVCASSAPGEGFKSAYVRHFIEGAKVLKFLGPAGAGLRDYGRPTTTDVSIDATFRGVGISASRSFTVQGRFGTFRELGGGAGGDPTRVRTGYFGLNRDEPFSDCWSTVSAWQVKRGAKVNADVRSYVNDFAVIGHSLKA